LANPTRHVKRRSRAALEAAVAAASGPGRAQAHYDLALFHENNGREAEAIPHYEAALSLDLSGPQRAECLAWLASSLYKTGRPAEALQHLATSRAETNDRKLLGFLDRLERRLRRSRLAR
jgi:tetratricopeptide (TPR) repeat protein